MNDLEYSDYEERIEKAIGNYLQVADDIQKIKDERIKDQFANYFMLTLEKEMRRRGYS